MSQTAERVCTLRSLIDRGYEIVGVVGKISKSNSQEEGCWKKVKTLIAKGRVGF